MVKISKENWAVLKFQISHEQSFWVIPRRKESEFVTTEKHKIFIMFVHFKSKKIYIVNKECSKTWEVAYPLLHHFEISSRSQIQRRPNE